MAAWNMQLAGKRGHPLPRHHPLYRRKLELSAEHTALAPGHRSLLENCPLFLCLILGVHSTTLSAAGRNSNCGFSPIIFSPGCQKERCQESSCDQCIDASKRPVLRTAMPGHDDEVAVTPAPAPASRGA